MPEPTPPASPKKRSFFQFHLSTVFVLMILASLLLWVNLRERELPLTGSRSGFSGRTGLESSRNGRGWPYPWYEIIEYRDSNGQLVLTGWNDLWVPWIDSRPRKNLAMDVGFALLVLLLVGIGCEWRIRRSDRKTNP